MANAMGSAAAGSAHGATRGFTDGLGDRVVVAGPSPGELLEVLNLRAEFISVSSFEFALRERAARLANFQHEAYARVRHIDRLPPAPGCQEGRLAVVSDYKEGWRLSEILATTGERHLEIDINVALSLIRQLVHAVAVLHRQARGVAHGAITPERCLVTPQARLVLLEYVLGSALERLEMTRERLWRELRIAVPPAAGASRFDHRADVTQVGAVALALVLGRPLGATEFPHHVAELLGTATENRALGERQPLSKPLRAWLARSLQLDFRNSFQSAIDAEQALETMLSEAPGYTVAPVALETFLAEFRRTTAPGSVPAPPAIPEREKPASSFSAPAPDVPRKTSPPAFEAAALETTEDENEFVLDLEDLDASTAAIISSTPEPPGAGLSATYPGSKSADSSIPPDGASAADASVLLPERKTGSSFESRTTDERDPWAESRKAERAEPPSEARSTGIADARSAKKAESSPEVKSAKGQPAPPDLDAGYPGGFESLFGTADEKNDRRVAEFADEEMALHDAEPRSRKRIFLVGGVAAAVVALAVGGYFAYRALAPATQAPTTGTLVVESRPPGLSVTIDGAPGGTTPLKKALAPGQHRLEIETGGEPRVIPINVTAGTQVSQYIDLPAQPVTGRLQVTSEPPGAVVVVDGQRKGAAPILVADLSVGTHRVELLSDGGRVTREVAIEAGGTNSLVIPVARDSGPVSGWISVSAPVELKVYEGEQLIGTTGSDKILITAGRHDFDIVNDTLGYHGRQSVQVTAGRTSTIRVQLPNGTLNVNAIPWAEVLIDGQRAGETPIGNLAVPIGPHEVVFRHPQLGEQRHAVTVTTRAPARLSVDLRK